MNYLIYSVRRLFTGLISADLMARKLTVASVMMAAMLPATAKIHQLILVRITRSICLLFPLPVLPHEELLH